MAGNVPRIGELDSKSDCVEFDSLAGRQELLNNLLDNLGYTPTETIDNRFLLYKDLIYALVFSKNIEAAGHMVNRPEAGMYKLLTYIRKKHFPYKPIGVKWDNYLLSFINNKKCNLCYKILSIESFCRDSRNWDSISQTCVSCKAHYRQEFSLQNPNYNKEHYISNRAIYISRAIKYKTKRSIATPSWADLNKIKEIYNNCPEGYHVDHIVPLQGDTVCGLHVENNLQYLLATENIRKSNRYIETPV